MGPSSACALRPLLPGAEGVPCPVGAWSAEPTEPMLAPSRPSLHRCSPKQPGRAFPVILVSAQLCPELPAGPRGSSGLDRCHLVSPLHPARPLAACLVLDVPCPDPLRASVWGLSSAAPVFRHADPEQVDVSSDVTCGQPYMGQGLVCSPLRLWAPEKVFSQC